jgi:hypothetical protein
MYHGNPSLYIRCGCSGPRAVTAVSVSSWLFRATSGPRAGIGLSRHAGRNKHDDTGNLPGMFLKGIMQWRPAGGGPGLGAIAPSQWCRRHHSGLHVTGPPAQMLRLLPRHPQPGTEPEDRNRRFSQETIADLVTIYVSLFSVSRRFKLSSGLGLSTPPLSLHIQWNVRGLTTASALLRLSSQYDDN